MELMPGGELFDLIVERGVMNTTEVCLRVSYLCSCLGFWYHSTNYLSSELYASNWYRTSRFVWPCHLYSLLTARKPENLLVDQSGTIVKVTDFGASKNFNEDALTTKIGTPNYLAPEIYLGMHFICIIPFFLQFSFWPTVWISCRYLESWSHQYGFSNEQWIVD